MAMRATMSGKPKKNSMQDGFTLDQRINLRHQIELMVLTDKRIQLTDEKREVIRASIRRLHELSTKKATLSDIVADEACKKIAKCSG